MLKRQSYAKSAFDVIISMGHRLFLVFIFALIVACTTPPKWDIHEGPATVGYPGEHWQKAATPEQLGWSSEKLALARAYSKNIGSAAVMIVDNGIVVDAWGDVTKKFKCHSMRKSLLSALIGIHVNQGNINLSKTIEELDIDDYEPSLTQDEKQATVGDLIRARSGIYHPALGEAGPMKALRSKRYSHSPGTYWYYNNWDFNALGTIFEQEANMKICKAFDHRIAQALQMEDFKIGDCRNLIGNDLGEEPVSMHRYYFFRMSARDLARFGLLFLREGQWQNKPILSAKWVGESTASHSKRGDDSGYGYMWWTGVKGGLFANVKVKGHSYYASGWGGQKVIVLPYRKLLIVHRVNTDWPGNHVENHQIGRLLWLILAASGETEIGADPSIEASKGKQLTNDELNQLLAEDVKWVGPNNGIFPGGELIRISCNKDGKMLLLLGEGVDFTGKWWISGNRFYFKILGLRSYFHIIQDNNTIKLFDPSGTLFGKFRQA